jgi:hypothetical protein
MSYTALFVLVFGGLFVLRIVAATIVFALLMPRSERCPDCDSDTEAVVSPLLDRFLPWFRRSWCLACGWEGVLRRSPVTSETESVEPEATRTEPASSEALRRHRNAVRDGRR